MSRKSWHLDRRTFLCGAGVAAALPFLEGMSWAMPKGASAPKRMCFVYFPNGFSLPSHKDEENSNWRWFPVKAGHNYELTDVLKPPATYAAIAIKTAFRWIKWQRIN